MLTGKELGAAIDRARTKKGLSKKALADRFKVKPPSVQGWITTGRIDKSKLMEVIDFFSDVVDHSHWGLGRSFSSTSLSDEPKSDQESTSSSLSSSDTRNKEQIELARRTLDAISFIAVFAAGGMLSEKDARSIIDIRNRLAHAQGYEERSYTALPDDLQALAESAISVAEAAGNARDLVSMLEHGMSKKRPKKESTEDVRSLTKREAQS